MCGAGCMAAGAGDRNAAPVGGALKSVQVTEGNVRGRGGAQGKAADTEESATGRWRRLRLLGTRGGFREKVSLEDTSAGTWKARDS